LTWCEGAVQVEGGRVSLAWRKEGSKNIYRLAVPAAYSVAMEGNSAAWDREI
jgi:hypothetical protein